MTQFQLWEPVLFHNHLTTFPSTSTKILVRFVGFSDSVGNAGCYKVYNEATVRPLAEHYYSASVNAYMKSMEWNHIRRAQVWEPDDVPTELIKSGGNPERGEPSPIPIGIKKMLNRTFLLQDETDGSRHVRKSLRW